MRPERASAGRPSPNARDAARRARRRTLFSSAGSARREPAANEQHPTRRGDEVWPVVVDPRPPAADGLDLAEFVVDHDDYPEVAADRLHIARPTAAVPDRVDDIDDWLEEFAVEDYWDSSPRS